MPQMETLPAVHGFCQQKRLAPIPSRKRKSISPLPSLQDGFPCLLKTAEPGHSKTFSAFRHHSPIPSFPQQSRYILLGLHFLNPCTKLKRLAVRQPHYNLV